MIKATHEPLGQVSEHEIRQLRVFKAVVDCGGFTAAEADLNIGRSTISLHISKLEKRLNLRLCRRGRAGFALTEDGLAVYQATLTLLAALEAFRTTVNGLHAQLVGTLRIIASDTVSLHEGSGLARTVARFSGLAPEVYLQLDVGVMNEIERMVLREEADIGIVPYHRDIEGLVYAPLYEERCHLYCSHHHPLAGLDEADVTAALDAYPVAHAGIEVSDEVGRQFAGLRKAATAYHYETRLALILSGSYLGFLPDEFAAPWVARNELRRLLPEQRSYALGVAAITKAHARQKRARALFMQLLTEQFLNP